MRFVCLLLAFFLAAPESETVTEVLFKGEIVANNILTALTAHVRDDPNFKLPPDQSFPPRILVRKDGSFYSDQTPAQHARALMEEIRLGIHALRAADKPKGIDAVAFEGAKENWPKLRDISCKDAPKTRYYDLDGFEQYCP